MGGVRCNGAAGRQSGAAQALAGVRRVDCRVRASDGFGHHPRSPPAGCGNTARRGRRVLRLPASRGSVSQPGRIRSDNEIGTVTGWPASRLPGGGRRWHRPAAAPPAGHDRVETARRDRGCDGSILVTRRQEHRVLRARFSSTYRSEWWCRSGARRRHDQRAGRLMESSGVILFNPENVSGLMRVCVGRHSRQPRSRWCESEDRGRTIPAFHRRQRPFPPARGSGNEGEVYVASLDSGTATPLVATELGRAGFAGVPAVSQGRHPDGATDWSRRQADWRCGPATDERCRWLRCIPGLFHIQDRRSRVRESRSRHANCDGSVETAQRSRIVAPAADYVDFRLSPDDTRLAYSSVDPRGTDVGRVGQGPPERSRPTADLRVAH